jgi:hypothetical protein
MTVRFTPMPGLREDPAVAGSSSPVIVLFHTAAPDRSTLSIWKPDIASGQDALSYCEIIMVTGDYGLTAESIARRIGIIREAQPRIVTGADLDSMDEAALRDALMGEVIRGRYSLVEKIAADSSVVGRTIADLDLPEECVIAAIIRRGHLILPHGDTMLQTGDDVLALTSTERLQRLAEILGKSA